MYQQQIHRILSAYLIPESEIYNKLYELFANNKFTDIREKYPRNDGNFPIDYYKYIEYTYIPWICDVYLYGCNSDQIDELDCFLSDVIEQLHIDYDYYT